MKRNIRRSTDLRRESLPELQQFPVPINLDGRNYQFHLWQGQRLPDRLIAYDTETVPIKGDEIPELALATVYGDLGSAYFIHPQQLAEFIGQHRRTYWVSHNSTFDFWVTAQALQHDPVPYSDWWRIAGEGRLICTMLLDVLVRLAQIDAEPRNRDLATVAKHYNVTVPLDKNDPFRLRYGELVGRQPEEWIGTEQGFWTYAAADPVATLAVAQKQFAIADKLIDPYRGELLPDAIHRYGPLTVCLQVQGSIALEYCNRTGVHIDLPQVERLRTEIATLVKQHQKTLEQLLPGCFKVYGPRSKQTGEYQRTESGAPRRNAKLIKQHLEVIANKCERPITPPRLKNGLVTDSVKYWKQHSDLHRFVDTYVRFSEQSKLLQFFAKLDQPHVTPRYRPMGARTGRTSCSSPNLQQIPRSDEFRRLFLPPPDHYLLQIDYSTAELRALAEVCLRRYGRSRLAELFSQGIDCHAFTAASLLGLTIQEFEQLPKRDQKQHRQAAKAVGFGSPAGLGPRSLAAYAKQSYGIDLSVDDARDLRERLITEVYPELSLYLRDHQQADIARNLKTTEQGVRQVLPRRDLISTVERIIGGSEESLDGRTYDPRLIDHAWSLMQQLNRNPDVADELNAKKPSIELMRRCFFGSACSLTGRVRAHINYTQCRNTPFQSLVADAGKLAMFRLLRAGFRLLGFVHDEILIAIPFACDYENAIIQVQQVMIEAMEELTPKVPAATESILADCWTKSADAQPLDAKGRITPLITRGSQRTAIELPGFSYDQPRDFTR